MLRHRADRRTLVWALAMPIVALAPYVDRSLAPYLCPLSCYLALAAGVIAHNHNHCPTFKSKRLNALFGYWLSIFYGYPVFAWVPTHNLNHHKFLNRAGDATITWRHSAKNHALVASTYFFVSSYHQSAPIKAYIRQARATRPALFRSIVSQYLIWAGIHLALIALACVRHGLWHGTLVWSCAFGAPALFALWTIMLFNFIQHVHTDPWSEHNHSRNFTSRSMNYLLFNNALHTPHHERAGAHWSTLWEAFERIKPEIHPELRTHSFTWWLVRNYLLAPFFPRLGTRQIGRAPNDPPLSHSGDASGARGFAFTPVERGAAPRGSDAVT